MKLSSKARYGLKAMCVMADNESAIMSVTRISSETDVSEAYLEQLFAILKRAELVRSVRGAGGGYKLSRPPGKISVGEIIRALEDGLEIVECIGKQCDNRKKCKTYDVWYKLYDTINAVLDKMALSELITREDTLCEKSI